MVTQEVLITNPSGLHARPAHRFIKLAKSFKSDVFLDTGQKQVRCDSIINLLLAAVKPGMTVTVRAEGEDERNALDELVAFLEGLAKSEAEPE
ncbi:MAG: HPr family phosphocarrier protein [Deltaproteobacteria bacterium]|jgi:phosphotransferase system HPr (HPr) family protein|nr:HPr family phosphocarrier protein [Deltaproteobacteria bacterium]